MSAYVRSYYIPLFIFSAEAVWLVDGRPGEMHEDNGSSLTLVHTPFLLKSWHKEDKTLISGSLLILLRTVKMVVASVHSRHLEKQRFGITSADCFMSIPDCCVFKLNPIWISFYFYILFLKRKTSAFYRHFTRNVAAAFRGSPRVHVEDHKHTFQKT